MLIFTPSEVGEERAEAVIAGCLGHVDAIQVRVKASERRSGPSPAAELRDWTRRVLRLREGLDPESRPLVFVNDRVDVAQLLAEEGVDGVHLGQADTPASIARELLGQDLLIGLSTDSARTLLAAEEQPVDYLGLGPIFPSQTKGYARGLGPEAAWALAAGTGRPVFPIGGIDRTNALELLPIGRAAVGAGVLAADDPGRAAAELGDLLCDPFDAGLPS